jgi:hypothetical protein
VVLLEAVGGFERGTVGAVVEVYAVPDAAYDIEVVTDDGRTEGLIEAVRPDQIRVVAGKPRSVVAAAAGGTRQD